MGGFLEALAPRAGDGGAAGEDEGECDVKDEQTENLKRYLANAPAPEVLDNLEAQSQRSEVRAIRQFAPGKYSYVDQHGLLRYALGRRS